MFRGTFEGTIGRRGRISIPEKFRQSIGDNNNELVVTNFITAEGIACLDVYPLAAWQTFTAEYASVSMFSPEQLTFQNSYLGGSRHCHVEGRGRLLIPAPLRRSGHLTREIMLTAANNKFRIWDREIWQNVRHDAELAIILENASKTKMFEDWMFPV